MLLRDGVDIWQQDKFQKNPDRNLKPLDPNSKLVGEEFNDGEINEQVPSPPNSALTMGGMVA